MSDKKRNTGSLRWQAKQHDETWIDIGPVQPDQAAAEKWLREGIASAQGQDDTTYRLARVYPEVKPTVTTVTKVTF